MIQQQQRSPALQGRRRPSETLWGAVLWTLAWFLVMVLLALVGVGTWRFIDQAQEYADRRSSIKELDEEIIQLIDQINNISGIIPSSCTVNVNNLTQPLEYPDDEFQIFSYQDNSSGIVFDLLGPGSNVTLSVQNTSGIIAYLGQIEAQSVIFFDDEFAVFNAAITSKVVMLDLSSISAMTIQTLRIQDASGTIAYLSDIPPDVTTFLDDEFTVYSVGDPSKKVMLDCSIIASSTVQTMTVQDASGTILYLGDIANMTGVPFPDDEFFVHADGNTSTRVMLNAGIISTMTTVVMTIQDRSGVIAYLSDIMQVVEVFMNESRPFPDPSEEGVTTLAGLGNVVLLEISSCGGGGAGGMFNSGEGLGEIDDASAGGSGGGFQNFRITNAGERFTFLNISLGRGGTYTNESDNSDVIGHPTIITGTSSIGFYLNLTAYGGGGGGCCAISQERLIAGGGGGGGPGTGVTTNEGGPSGNLGGVKGGNGADGSVDDQSFFQAIPSEIGPYRLPWRGGSGGAVEFVGLFDVPKGAPFQGGYDTEDDDVTGGASLFGRGGLRDQNPPDVTIAGYCGGGATVQALFLSPFTFLTTNGSNSGGDGAALIRYYLK